MFIEKDIPREASKGDRDVHLGHLGVNPKIGGKPPKWMVKIMENPIKMDDLGVPLFLETPIYDRETVQLFHNQQMSICTNQKPPLGASKLPILNQPALQKLETTYNIYIYIYEALSKFLAGLLV